MPHSLRTDRLLIRPALLRDAPAFVAACNDREVTKATKTWPWPVTSEIARTLFRNTFDWDPWSDISFHLLHEGVLIGGIGVHRREGDVFGVGYMLGRPWWGQGLATEAVRAVCDFTFRTLRAGEIEGDVFQDNPASARVLMKAGFRFQGDIGPGLSTTLGGDFPRHGYRLRREWQVR